MKNNRARKRDRWYGQTDAIVDLEELNVVEFPMAILARHVPNRQKTIQFHDTIRDASTGELLNRTLAISASDSSNLPNWWDQDVLISLQVLTNRKNGFRSAVVEFSIYELLKLMGLKNDGRNRQRIAESLDNWQGVRFKYSHWRSGDRWLNPSAFCLIQDYNLTRRGRRAPEQPQVFTWSRVFLESVQASHTKGFDAEFYFKLKLPTTRRMFRLLDKRLWKRLDYSYPLTEFCTEKLGMSRNYKPSEYARKIEPAYEELVGKGFLEDVAAKDRFVTLGRGAYRVNFRRRKVRCGRQAAVPPPTALQQQLVGRGVTAAVATTLVTSVEYGEERVNEKIELFDWYAQRGQPKGGGWLRKAIEDDYQPPSGFQTKAQQEERRRATEERQRKAAEAERAQQERIQREKDKKRAVVDGYLSSLSAADREALEQEAFAQAPKFTRRFCKRVADGEKPSPMAEAARQQTIEDYVLQLVARQNEPDAGVEHQHGQPPENPATADEKGPAGR